MREWDAGVGCGSGMREWDAGVGCGSGMRVELALKNVQWQNLLVALAELRLGVSVPKCLSSVRLPFKVSSADGCDNGVQ
jgi:hypothetical protein